MRMQTLLALALLFTSANFNPAAASKTHLKAKAWNPRPISIGATTRVSKPKQHRCSSCASAERDTMLQALRAHRACAIDERYSPDGHFHGCQRVRWADH